MNLKAHVPIIALCGLTFLVSFAAGLWWEISQQDEWGTSASSGQDENQSIAQRRTDKEKSKSEQKDQTDPKRDKADDDKKGKPAKPEEKAEDSKNRPVEGAPEPGVAPNISPAGPPANAIRVRGGMKRMDMSNMSEEQRAKVEEAIRTARQAASREGGRVISSVEISSESDSSITVTDETEMIIVEPDN